VLQYRALEHWDGKLPTYSGGALPLLTFDASKFAMGADDAAREKKLNQLLAEDAAKAAAPPAPAPPPEVPQPAAPAPAPKPPAK
jgi:hypothetical protein